MFEKKSQKREFEKILSFFATRPPHLSVRTQHTFRKILSFLQKIGRPHLKNPPPPCSHCLIPPPPGPCGHSIIFAQKIGRPHLKTLLPRVHTTSFPLPLVRADTPIIFEKS